MRKHISGLLAGVAVLTGVGVGLIAAQGPVPSERLPAPVRRTPTITWTANPGFRDWGAAVRAGGVLIASNATGGGGLFAVDEATGKLRWKVGREHASAAPVSDGKVVAVAWWQDEAIAAYTVAGGKPVWRKAPFRFVNGTGLTLHDGVVLAEDATTGVLHALDLATGATRWTRQVTPKFWHCGAGPVVAGDTVYVASGLQPPSDAKTEFFLHALDRATGAERWRYNPPPEYPNRGTCLTRIVVVGDTVVAIGDGYLYGVDRETGRQTYRVAPLDGNRRLPMTDLVAAGDLVIGVTTTFIGAFDAKTGRLAWKLPGTYRENVASLAVADGVLYFEGRVTGVDAASEDGGVLHALDLQTRAVLWTFAGGREVPWSYSHILPFDGGLYVDTYKALLKLQ